MCQVIGSFNITARIIIWVVNRPIGRCCRWPEPRPVHPASKSTHSACITGILRWHINVMIPEISKTPPASTVPCRILQGQLVGRRYKSTVLNNQWNLIGPRWYNPIENQFVVGWICYKIPCGLSQQDIETGDTPGVIMIEHQARTLLICVVKGRATISFIRAIRYTGNVNHIGDITHTHTFRLWCSFVSRSYPLVGRTITDPRRYTTMKMECSAVVFKTPDIFWILRANGITNFVRNSSVINYSPIF